MCEKMMQISIVGSGVGGLTLGYELVNSGYSVELFEKESQPGGLCRSYSYPSGYTFDIGPHRIKVVDVNLYEFIEQLIGKNYNVLARNNAMFMNGKYYSWPISYKTILELPLKDICISTAGYLKQRFMKDNMKCFDFEQYVVKKYGKKIYDLFFASYTEKVTTIKGNELHEDWVLETFRRIYGNENSCDTLFLYPLKGGIQTICNSLSNTISSKIGKIYYNSPINSLKIKNGEIKTVTSNNIKYDTEIVVWTAPLTQLCNLLGIRTTLKFVSILCFNIEIDYQLPLTYQWCYYGEPNIPFSRISFPKQFSYYNVPTEKDSLCIEVIVKKDSPAWNNPACIYNKIINSLINIRLIEGKNAVNNLYHIKVPDAYPLYTLDFKTQLNLIFQKLSKINNLLLMGRSGAFWYNNIDDSIYAAKIMSNYIVNLNGTPKALESVNQVKLMRGLR